MCNVPNERYSASILYKSIAGRYRPVSYPDGPITTRYRFIIMLTGTSMSRVWDYCVRMCAIPRGQVAVLDTFNTV